MKAPRPTGLNDELVLFASVVGEMADTHVAKAAEQIDRSGAVPDGILALLADNELLTAGLPGDVGGGDGGDVAAVLMVERLAAASAAVATIPISTHVCGVLAPQLGGELAEGPSAALVIPTLGETLELRDHRLHGRASRVESAIEAHHLVVVIGDEAVVVNVASPGVTVLPADARTGLRGARTQTVIFQDVALADAGTDAAHGLRLHWLLGAALCCGIARAAATEAVTYLDERRQFGQRLSEFAALRAMVADAHARIASAAAALFTAAESGSTVDAAVAATTAATAVVDVAIDAVQLHGGYGWTTEYPVERLMRDAVSARARLGGTRGMRGPIIDLAFTAA